MKKLKKILFASIIISTIISVRVFVFDLYNISSGSMYPTIIPGDYVLVNKISYGPRILNICRFLFFKEISFIRLKGFKTIQRNDVIVFNYPQYEYLSDSLTFIYGTRLIKRCFKIAGDTVVIRPVNEILSSTFSTSNDLFPYDTSLHWSLEKYGPLYVPKKNHNFLLNHVVYSYYKDILLYENAGIPCCNDSANLNNMYNRQYSFKYDYYFMLGDNFYQSYDSRFWGFLPETHIIGKASLVLFSLDPDKPWYAKFRWKRFFKIIR